MNRQERLGPMLICVGVAIAAWMGLVLLLANN